MSSKNVHLTTMDAQQFLMAAMEPSCRQSDLPKMRENNMITGKVHADRNKLCPGKEWKLQVHMPSILVVG